jgi:hypothetical protein
VTIEERSDRVEHLLEEVAERSGAIVAIRDGDDTVVVSAGSDGLGRDGGVDTVVPMFCLAKPLVAVAIDEAVRDGELSLDDRLGDLIETHPSLRDTTVIQLLEHRSGLTGPSGIRAGLLGSAERRALLADPPESHGHPAHYSELLGFEALGWCLEEALGSDIGSLVTSDGVWLGEAAASIDPTTVWVNEVVNPEGISYPLLFPLSGAALVDANPGFGGYCRPAAYLEKITPWLCEPGAPRSVRLAFDGAFTRPISWNRGVCTSLGRELQLGTRPLIGHLGFMGASCVAFSPDTEVSVYAVVSPLLIDVESSRRFLGRIVDAATPLL